jgi:hypothetical protein
MSIAYQTHPPVAASPATENQVLQTTHTTLKYLFGLVPMVAGVDKFTHFLTPWDAYLNPLVSSALPLSATTVMHVVGAIEIAAGILVFLRPRIGGFVVMGWLLAIALQLILWGHFLDVAVRDIVIALAGALTLARLTPLVERTKVSAR